MTFKCWIDGRKETTVQFIEAETHFAARQRLALQHGLKTYQVIVEPWHTLPDSDLLATR
jgi:hypothetical protein